MLEGKDVYQPLSKMHSILFHFFENTFTHVRVDMIFMYVHIVRFFHHAKISHSKYENCAVCDGKTTVCFSMNLRIDFKHVLYHLRIECDKKCVWNKMRKYLRPYCIGLDKASASEKVDGGM